MTATERIQIPVTRRDRSGSRTAHPDPGCPQLNQVADEHVTRVTLGVAFEHCHVCQWCTRDVDRGDPDWGLHERLLAADPSEVSADV